MNRLLWVALVTVALVACQAGSGTGSGRVRGTHKPVAFTWQGHDSVSGNMTATFGNGRVFKGKYIHITENTDAARLGFLWDGWGDPVRRGDWKHWSRHTGPKFWKTYNGRVLANLHSPDGESMRCRFTLLSTQRGMAGGGDGRCQLSDSGAEIRAQFRRQS